MSYRRHISLNKPCQSKVATEGCGVRTQRQTVAEWCKTNISSPSERQTGSQETDRVRAAGRLGGTAVFSWNVLLFPHQEFSFDLNQTLYVHGKLPAGPSTSTAGFCVRLPSLDPFIVSQYWFRNKSSWLIQWSTFPSKRAGRAGCVGQAAPHVAVFIVSPPLKINEKFPDGRAECERWKYNTRREAGGFCTNWKCPTNNVYLGVISQLEHCRGMRSRWDSWHFLMSWHVSASGTVTSGPVCVHGHSIQDACVFAQRVCAGEVIGRVTALGRWRLAVESCSSVSHRTVGSC